MVCQRTLLSLALLLTGFQDSYSLICQTRFNHAVKPRKASSTVPRRVNFNKGSQLTRLSFSGDDIGVGLYDFQVSISHFIEVQLAAPTPASLSIIYASGLLTAFSPCSISLLPLTMAYLGYEQGKSSSALITRAALYAGGLAATLTAFGLSAALLGTLFGSSGGFSEVTGLISSAVLVVMGLYLLGIVTFEFPSYEADVNTIGGVQIPPSLQAFLLGATSALIASPCSSPVLTSLLAIVASSGDAKLGAAFLFTYGMGYATPVVAAGLFSGNIVTTLLQKSGETEWVNTALASILIFYGTYSSLDTVTKILQL